MEFVSRAEPPSKVTLGCPARHPLRPAHPRRWCYDCGHMAEESGALKILANVRDLLNKLAAPAAEQIGQLLGYKLHPYTVKNFVATMKKTERILRAAGLPANPVPPRLLLPIAEGSSIENNESLQELWAGQMATASQQGDSVSPSFIETLRQLTPDEARYLHGLYCDPQKELSTSQGRAHPNCIDGKRRRSERVRRHIRTARDDS
jgi:Abortive infection alpha